MIRDDGLAYDAPIHRTLELLSMPTSLISIRTYSRRLAGATLALTLLSFSAHAASLQGLGLTRVHDLSADGSTAVGALATPAYEAYRWTAATGPAALDPLGGAGDDAAYGVSADGAIIVGTSGAYTGGGGDAFRWTSASGVVALPSPQDLYHEGAGFDVARDGSSVVGATLWQLPGQDMLVRQATRWTAGGGAVGLGILDPTLSGAESVATAASADGSVVVGLSTNSLGQYAAFRWTEAGGMVGLGFLHPGPGLWPSSLANDVSADGSIVVGASLNEVAGQVVFEAFLWTDSQGMLALGFSESADLFLGGSMANAITGDGSIVVGSSGGRASIWDAQYGMRDLADVLAGAGLGLGGWVLLEATGISDDGLTIVGNGINPSGQEEAWIVRVPEPGAATLVALVVAALLARRGASLR